MQIITTKTRPQASKTTRSPQEQRFDAAWKRVAKQQKENDRFREKARTFAQETINLIQEKEKACMDTMYDTCLHLLGFLSRKSLTLWQRETLIAWVDKYLRTLQNNPFSTHLDFSPIMQRMDEAIKAMYPDLSNDPAFNANGSPESTHGHTYSEDEFQDFFAEFEQANATGGPGHGQDDADADPSFFQDFFKQRQAFEQQRHEECLVLKRLMKSSSVNRLFRKIAGILHPDKEPNEVARQEKNRLMSELIQARNSNDIPRIFAFYAKYVGESPMQELGEDLDSITQLLERQYQDLRNIKDNILDEDPLTSIIYRRFHQKSAAATQRVINKHLKDTETHTHTLRTMRQSISSLNKLKPYLELHYEIFIQEDALDFI